MSKKVPVKRPPRNIALQGTTEEQTKKQLSPRRLSKPKRVWYNPKSWDKPTHTHAPLPKARYILKNSLTQLNTIKKVTIGISAIYGAGVLILVRSISSSQDFPSIQYLLDGIMTGSWAKIKSLAAQLSVLFSDVSSTNTVNGGLYETVLLIICSLAVIWVLRQSQAKKPIGVKMAFYRGMYPLVPFVLVVAVIGLQLIPTAVASYLYTLLIGGGIAIGFLEKSIALIALLVVFLWSLRAITGSIFALYIVTLVDMTPMRALRSAKNLVRGRRLMIWRKLLFLPVFIIIASSVIILPFMLFLPSIVIWVFFVITTAWLPVIHAYLYSLYRELLNEKV